MIQQGEKEKGYFDSALELIWEQLDVDQERAQQLYNLYIVNGGSENANMFRDIISEVGKTLEQKKGIQEMTLDQTKKARNFLVNQSHEMAILKKRFDTVNKTR